MGDIVERLLEVALEKQQEAWGRIDGGQDLSIGATLAEETAAEIERLRATMSAITATDCYSRDECTAMARAAITPGNKL